MGDYLLLSPDHRHAVQLDYVGEPPHGDSYHDAYIDGTKLPGFVWGCTSAFTPDGNYWVASWMPRLFERRTVAVDLANRCYFVLPRYIADFAFRWPKLSGAGTSVGLDYTFDGSESWMRF
jgi:hypothetical protein